jgi:hypothetical protein
VVNRLIKLGADPNHLTKLWCTPLHYAIYHGRVEVLHLLLQAGGNSYLIDGFGRNALDWASSYAPAFKAMGDIRECYKPTDRAISFQHLAKTIQSLLQSTQAYDNWLSFLGRCFLQAEDESEAIAAFEQMIWPHLDRTTVVHKAACGKCTKDIEGIRYVCKVCADSDLCEPCWKKYINGDGIRNCSNHTFLKVPSAAWQTLKPGQVNTSGESMEEWIERLQQQWDTIALRYENSPKR